MREDPENRRLGPQALQPSPLFLERSQIWRDIGISTPGRREACNEKHLRVGCLRPLLPERPQESGSHHPSRKPQCLCTFCLTPHNLSAGQRSPRRGAGCLKERPLAPAGQGRQRQRPEPEVDCACSAANLELCGNLEGSGISVGFWPVALWPQSKLFND